MGIYGVKSTSCECRGSWATLDSDHRVYMKTPCSEHELTQGNQIYYKIHHLFEHITKNRTINTNIIKYEPKYLVKILDVKKIDRKKCIKIELIHNGSIDVSNFNESKNIINSQFNDEPMWQKIDDNTIHLIILYQGCHHTIESDWKPEDY